MKFKQNNDREKLSIEIKKEVGENAKEKMEYRIRPSHFTISRDRETYNNMIIL